MFKNSFTIFLSDSFRILKAIPENIRNRHLVLLALTLFSATITYSQYCITENSYNQWIDSFTYSLTLITILVAHELGHYLNARNYGVDVTPPYLIPFPYLSPFGTLGAFIKMKSLPPDYRALFDISFWGPFMSFALSIPAMVLGIYLSDTVDSTENGLILQNGELIFGTSILIKLIIYAVRDLPEGVTIIMHPFAFAGWTGFFITAINLLPIGQLDGGHIAYIFFRKRQKYLAWFFIFVIIILSLESSFGWIFFLIILVVMGIKHPALRMQNSEFMLDRYRSRLGIFAASILLLCFVLNPIQPYQKKEPIYKPDTWEKMEQYNNLQKINYPVNRTKKKSLYERITSFQNFSSNRFISISTSPLQCKNITEKYRYEDKIKNLHPLKSL